MKLYEITGLFEELFTQFEDIQNYEPDTDADGNYIDEDGDIIENVDRLRENMLTAWYDTLEALEFEFDEKAENIGAYIKSLTAMSKVLKNEEENLRARRQRLDREAEGLRKYLLSSMEKLGRTKINTPRAVISVRNNPESVEISDEPRFIEWAQSNDHEEFLKYREPEIRKAPVKALLKIGGETPFASLKRTKTLIIK